VTADSNFGKTPPLPCPVAMAPSSVLRAFEHRIRTTDLWALNSKLLAADNVFQLMGLNSQRYFSFHGRSERDG